jgi:hypothetical protein
MNNQPVNKTLPKRQVPRVLVMNVVAGQEDVDVINELYGGLGYALNF